MANDEELARYILDWLRKRNGGELEDAVAAMTVASFEMMQAELQLILTHRGKPPNWV
jgi:hypothetical protein